MTRTDILIRFIKKSIAPIITAILLYNLFAGLYRKSGRRHFYDCCQHSNRRRNRRHNLNMEIACRRLLCAVHRC